MMIQCAYTQAPKHAETWLLLFDVAIRRGKWLQALKAVVQGRHLEPDNAAFAYRTVQVARHEFIQLFMRTLIAAQCSHKLIGLITINEAH